MDQQQPPGSSDAGLYASILSDPLSDVTRKERLYLLAVSIIGIAIVKTGLIPTEITTLGVKFEEANQNTLLSILALVGLYFLAAFLIYAVADLYTWVSAYQAAGGKAAFQQLEKQLNRAAKAKIEQWAERFIQGRELSSQEQKWRAAVSRDANLSQADLAKELDSREFVQNFGLPQQMITSVFDELQREIVEGSDTGQAATRLGVEIQPDPIRHEDDPSMFVGLAVNVGESTLIRRNERIAKTIAISRAAFEYLLPVVVGVYAVFLLLSGPVDATSGNPNNGPTDTPAAETTSGS
jgi:hypothetical protein